MSRSTVTFLTNNKTTHNWFQFVILRAHLNCWTTFTKILQFEEGMFYDQKNISAEILKKLHGLRGFFFTIYMLVHEF